ncbi:uncharacterized protein BO95DRAFT_237923 [Aspergillus brunneoviolaceus CBS 621.78]|uniref:Uncharacterized protein n=1 Tax=Aspergillus brunneoviolaceus CBS 621.78 TaxID=1450534 RepID=A0ACD1FZA8_9EURO|nr:hypothetical protein BO95DRAFT_237923 [Aspergillus brunneoviolaceus CBS 621.78]RAH42342.1 hypothetical protein BO95DRAFT_237923 [Aspergillus brunneoviolaceus CBS 621.78]
MVVKFPCVFYFRRRGSRLGHGGLGRCSVIALAICRSRRREGRHLAGRTGVDTAAADLRILVAMTGEATRCQGRRPSIQNAYPSGIHAAGPQGGRQRDTGGRRVRCWTHQLSSAISLNLQPGNTGPPTVPRRSRLIQRHTQRRDRPPAILVSVSIFPKPWKRDHPRCRRGPRPKHLLQHVFSVLPGTAGCYRALRLDPSSVPPVPGPSRRRTTHRGAINRELDVTRSRNIITSSWWRGNPGVGCRFGLDSIQPCSCCCRCSTTTRHLSRGLLPLDPPFTLDSYPWVRVRWLRRRWQTSEMHGMALAVCPRRGGGGRRRHQVQSCGVLLQLGERESAAVAPECLEALDFLTATRQHD